jgi:Tol biopolymer transport system component
VHRLLICTFCLLLVGASLAPAAKKETKPKKDIAADINAPRPEMRKVSFQTDEGTWMSMDVSPDGNTIVFDLLGDIYSLPISGGAAKSLTSGPGFDSHPRFSPDGKTIAFTSDRGGMENLWLMDADGKNPRALTSEKDSYVRGAAWTPDGKYLVARKEDAKKAGIPPVELWMYHINGGSGIQLTTGDEMNNASGPVVSRDNRYIFFSGRPINFNYIPDVSNGLWQIYRFDRETGETSQLTGGFGGAARPALSPDGKTMTFISRRDSQTVFVSRDLDSGGEKILLKDVTPDEQEGFAQMDIWPNYAFTPDGKSILFGNKGKIQKLDLDTQKTENIAFTVQVEQWLAPRVAWQEKINMGPVEARILRWPSQSSDGHWIAFDAFGRIWLQEISGGKAVGTPRRLTPDDSSFPRREYAPAFSPDGKWIA